MIAGPQNSADASVISVNNVSKFFFQRQDWLDRSVSRLMRRPPSPVVRAVDKVSLRLRRGEVVGLVGESGCGKSTLGRMVAGISKPTEGDVLLDGQPVFGAKGQARTRMRLRVQMVFQDPYASLNPRLRVEAIVGEAAVRHGLVSAKDQKAFAREQLARVELDPDYVQRFPHQFSGGQRQRVGIARALSVNPEFLVCDESVAALDVSIQAQILNLFMRIRDTMGLGYLFVTHDLGVVEHISDRVIIMYLGKIVEEALTEDVFARPNHPYTRALLGERPTLDVSRRTYYPIKGELPSPYAPPSGCHFHTRCPHVMDRCRVEAPPLRQISPGHSSACHLNGNP